MTGLWRFPFPGAKPVSQPAKSKAKSEAKRLWQLQQQTVGKEHYGRINMQNLRRYCLNIMESSAALPWFVEVSYQGFLNIIH